MGPIKFAYIFNINITILELRRKENWVGALCLDCVWIRHTCQVFWCECRNRGIHQSMWICRRTSTLWQDVLNVCHSASESRPERVRLCVHTTEPTGPVLVPFHCDHIARWSNRSGTTGCSGTGMNTSGTPGCVPVPFRSWGCGINMA